MTLFNFRLPYRTTSLFVLLWVACATSKPVVNPVTPPVIQPQKDTIIYKHDTVNNYVPVILTEHDTVLVSLHVDTSKRTITLQPMGGMQDDQPQIQAAVNAHFHIRLAAGNFYLLRPVIIANRQGNDYSQSWCDIEGESFAQNTVEGYATTVTQLFVENPAFIIQNGKGCVIRNLIIAGGYTPPSTQYQVNTYSRAQWRDGFTRDCPASPYAGIVIDPFSDPAFLNNDSTKGYPRLWSYYLPGMSRSGSTDIQITGCNFQGFNVGIVITAVNQQNGECITMDHDYFGNCMSAIASTQAQAKTNWVTHAMVWGGIHTIIDGVHYGINHSDGATVPEVDGMNIAGMVYQFCQTYDASFPQHYRNVYAENIVRVGSTGSQFAGGAGVTFTDCEFDFEPGSPSPGYWYHGASTSWLGCTLRYYDGIPHRIVLNDHLTLFLGGEVGSPPIRIFGQAKSLDGQIMGTTIFYPAAGQTWADSIVQSPDAVLRVNRADFTGYYVTTDTSDLTPGTLLLTAQPDTPDSLSHYDFPPPGPTNYQLALGWVDHLSKDTVFLTGIEKDQRDSTKISIYKSFYKHQ